MAIGGGIFGAMDDQESLRAVYRAIDLGLNFIDTADAYGREYSEELRLFGIFRGRDFL